MIDIKEAVQRLYVHEGCRLKPYRDTKGYLTIGIGRCLDKNPFTAEEKKLVGSCWQLKGITKEAAFMLLHSDILRTIKELAYKIPFWDNISDERQYALLDMAFQMGVNGVLKFKKMLAAIGSGDFETARKECLNSKYAREFKTRATRNADCLATGRYVF
ncbi:MAG: glycoside hydrolase family protein [Alphaproteobacteria bacterium]|nr:glycoside hydrolase family protein [Alphaproteobacteria bacterium]MBR1649415.1 glycoside hydrolase family protein [Alphaproteobacteria bacterium]